MADFVVNPRPETKILTPLTRAWRHRGAWSNTTPYIEGDIVTRDGSSWLCVTGHTGQAPTLSAQVWGLLALGGAGGGGSSSLAGLNDVNLDSLSDGQLLGWDNTAGFWTPRTVTAASLGAATEVALSNETIARQEADGDLSNSLAFLATSNNAAHANFAGRITALEGNRATTAALAAETAAREALDGRVTAIETALPDLVTSAQLLADVQTLQDADAALSGRLDALEIDPITATQAAGLFRALASPVPWADLSDVPLTFAPSAHTHGVGDITDLTSLLDGKAEVSHTHEIGDVTGLQLALDGKAATSHPHDASDITSGTFDKARLAPSGTDGQVLTLVSGVPAWAAPSGSSLPSGTTAQYLRHDGTAWAASALLAADIQTALNGNLTVTGTGQATVTVASASGSASRVIIASGDPRTRGLLYRTGDGTANTQDRWLFSVNATAESGSNAGSDWQLARYSDTGVLLGTVLLATRSTGLLTYNGAGITLQTGDLILTAGRLQFSAATSAIRMGSTAFTIENSGGSVRFWLGSLGNMRLEQSNARYAHSESTWTQSVSSAFSLNYDFGQRHVLTWTGSGTPAVTTIAPLAASSEVVNYAYTSEMVFINNSSVTYPAANLVWSGGNWKLPVAALPDIGPGQALILRIVRRPGGSVAYVTAPTLTAA